MLRRASDGIEKATNTTPPPSLTIIARLHTCRATRFAFHSPAQIVIPFLLLRGTHDPSRNPPLGCTWQNLASVSEPDNPPYTCYECGAGQLCHS